MAHIVVLGDSNSQGYWDERGIGWFGRMAELITKAMPYQHGFSNFSLSGDRSCDALLKLGWASVVQPDVLIIAIGSNDLIRWETKDSPTDMHPEFRAETWSKMLDVVESMNVIPLIVLTRPKDESKMPFHGFDDKPLYYCNNDIVEYNKDITKWCDDRNIPTLNVFNEWQEYGIDKLLYKDGVHHNGTGHQLLAEQVYAKLKQLNYLEE